MSITSITFRKNTLIIKFNDIMQSLDEHSITEQNNYLIKETIPLEATMTPMNDCRWIKITLPVNSPILPFLVDNNYTIKVGYVALKEIRYVETADGNIYPPCIINKIDEEVEEFNIEQGKITLSSHCTLLYEYLGKNELDISSLNIDDFEITTGLGKRQKLCPLKIIKTDYKTIGFLFPPKTFNASTNLIFLKTKPSRISTRDIYGYKILSNKSTDGSVVNRISSQLENISLIWDSDNTAIIRMVFNKSLSNFEIKDFKCTLNRTTTLPMTYENINFEDMKVLQISLKLSKPIFFNDVIEVHLAVPKELIRTLDVDGNKIKLLNSIKVSKFIAHSISWKRSNFTNLASNKIIINFNHPIDTKTLITHSGFDASINEPWDGKEALIIPPGNLFINHGAKYDFLYIKNNDSFGKIKVESKIPNGFIQSDFTNSHQVKLSILYNKKLILEFSNYENIPANTHLISLVHYIPFINDEFSTLENLHNKLFLYASYMPSVSPFGYSVIIVPPLKSSRYNPFKGGTLSGHDYIILLNNKHTYRDYGMKNRTTKICGNIKLVGPLSSGEQVNLINLNITGTMDIDICNGDAVFDNTNVNCINMY